MGSPTRRRDQDVTKLMMSDYEVELNEDPRPEAFDFKIKFPGPKDTPYEGGLWNIHVSLPMEYPFKSPSIGFLNRMYHPNVDERSGSVCLDVINQTWSPMFDLINVFEVFLPQLLRYPNPTDPLNGDAAALLLREPDKYNERVREYVKKFASPVTTETAEGCGAGAGRGRASTEDTERTASFSSSGTGCSDDVAVDGGDDGAEDDDDDNDDDDDDDDSVASDISEMSDL